MEENVIQINGGIMINVDVSVKNMYAKKIMFGILLHVIVKMENICQVLWIIQRLCVMKLQSPTMKTRKLNSYDKTKRVSTNFSEKNITCKTQVLCVTCIFINCYRITYSYQYLLLFDKILKKAKTFIKRGFKLIKMSNKVKDMDVKI